jgi:hypothetical protein
MRQTDGGRGDGVVRPPLPIAEARISNLPEAWVRWDARRSRLNRDFEVARIEFEHRRRLSAADYEANRRRNSL